MTDEQFRRICTELRTIILLLSIVLGMIGMLVWKLAPPGWLGARADSGEKVAIHFVGVQALFGCNSERQCA